MTVSSPCRVALLGYGAVGSAVARRLTSPDPDASPDVRLTHIFDRRADQKSASWPADGVLWTSSIDDVLHSDADVVVEAISGVEPDPSQIDTQSSASVTQADFVQARQRGGTIRQIARADYDHRTSTLTAWVAPVEVAASSIFARTVGAQNAALITGAHSGETGIFGAGAGGDATAVAVLSDIVAIARDKAAVVPAPNLTETFKLQTSKFRRETSDLRVESSVLLEAV